MPSPHSNDSIPKKLVSFPAYQDYSTKDHVWIENQILSTIQAKKSAGGAKTQFPLMLFTMLQDVEARGMSWIVGWQSHGRAFKIHNREQFESRILPFYFAKQSEISSFQRQLCLYGFLRLKHVDKHADQHAVYHEYFLRGRIDLCRLIHRKRSPTPARRRVYDSKREPNLYSFPPIRTESIMLVPPCPSRSTTEPAAGPNHVLGMQQSCTSFNGAAHVSLDRSNHCSEDLHVPRGTQRVMMSAAPRGVLSLDVYYPAESCTVTPYQGEMTSTVASSRKALPLSSASSTHTIVSIDSLDSACAASPVFVQATPSSMEFVVDISCKNARGNLKHTQSDGMTKSPVTILGLAEYLDSFHATPMVDDHSVLSEGDISCLTHQDW